MDSADITVLRTAIDWLRSGRRVALATVVETWGSSPRPPGAWLAIRDDGQVVGSVSGGCVEDDLIHRVRKGALKRETPKLVAYGLSPDDAARFGLPCGGRLRIAVEPRPELAALEALLERIAAGRLTARELDLTNGRCTLSDATRADGFSFDGGTMRTLHGPRWRLLVIGAGQLSHYVCQMALALDYEVVVIDPREEFAEAMAMPGVLLRREMPDDAILALGVDAHTAIAALTHDPKLDDMGLLEALKSPAFYVGALGSRRSTASRKARLAMFDLAQDEIERLHGPAGLYIGARTPAEIAVAILAEITAARHRVPVVQKRSLPAAERDRRLALLDALSQARASAPAGAR